MVTAGSEAGVGGLDVGARVLDEMFGGMPKSKASEGVARVRSVTVSHALWRSQQEVKIGFRIWQPGTSYTLVYSPGSSGTARVNLLLYTLCSTNTIRLPGLI